MSEVEHPAWYCLIAKTVYFIFFPWFLCLCHRCAGYVVKSFLSILTVLLLVFLTCCAVEKSAQGVLFFYFDQMHYIIPVSDCWIWNTAQMCLGAAGGNTSMKRLQSALTVSQQCRGHNTTLTCRVESGVIPPLHVCHHKCAGKNRQQYKMTRHLLYHTTSRKLVQKSQ